jgi:hypothetical protein
MRLVMTLLCRNEADIIASTVRFHLDRGVDTILVTDNASTDGTGDILAGFAAGGRVRVLQEPGLDHDQAVWVTRMAKLASKELGADWLIHGDADEFWWPAEGDLKSVLAAVPAEEEALAVERTNFLPPAPGDDPSRPFHQRQILRERRSCNALGLPLPPKVCHRAHPTASMSDGNHAVAVAGRPLQARPARGLEILHFPVRSYRQLERKIREGAEALERNARIAPEVGNTWRSLYRNELQQGRLPAYYAGLRPDEAAIEEQLRQGSLIRDTRLQQALAGHG